MSISTVSRTIGLDQNGTSSQGPPPNTNSPPTTTHASLSIVCKAHYHSCVVSSVFIFEHIIEISSAISLTCSFDLELIDKEPCTFTRFPPPDFYSRHTCHGHVMCIIT